MSYDSTSIKAAELLSYFGKNTCVTLTHNYGADEIEVRSARTNNVIALVMASNLNTSADVYAAALDIMAMRKFPRNRKMNKAWSPIRLTERAKADAEITRQTAMIWG